MVFLKGDIRKNAPAARLSHIDKFLAVFLTPLFLIFRTVSLESGEIRVNMLTRRFAFSRIGRIAKNFRVIFIFLRKEKRFRSLSNRVSFPRG